VRKRKVPPKKSLDEGGKKQGQPELTILVSPQTGRDEKGTPVSALVHWWVLVHPGPVIWFNLFGILLIISKRAAQINKK
jgi:hypothetical protein